MYEEFLFGNKYVYDDTNDICNVDKSDFTLNLNIEKLIDVYKEIGASNYATFFAIFSLVDRKKNSLKYNTLNDISNALNDKIDTFKHKLGALKKADLIKTEKIKNNGTLYINPFICFKGKSIDYNTFLLFQNTKWKRDDNELNKYMLKRTSSELTNWKKAVLKRDNKCVICGREENLDVHHILSYAKYKNLRTDVNNGITLCECHHSPMILNGFHQMYGTRNNTKEQLQEYIDLKRKELGLNPILIDEILNK